MGHSIKILCVMVLLFMACVLNIFSESLYGTKIEVDIPEYYLDSNWAGHLYPKYALMYSAIYYNILNPVWSHDGEWVFFTDGKYGIWKVSVSGGKPLLVYDNYDTHYWSGKPVTLGGLSPLCCSCDGKELVYLRYTINEEKDTEVRVNDEGSIIEIRYPYPVIESLNLETGETHLLAENAVAGYWSRDGRYFVYIERSDYRYSFGDIVVHEIETDALWSLDVKASSMCITPDNTCVLFTEGASYNSALYRAPLEGGVVEQLTFFDDTYEVTKSNLEPDISSDGEWVVFYGNFQFIFMELFLLNTYTEELLEIFPDVNVPYYVPNKEEREFFTPKWSPDGKRLCYVMYAEDYYYKMMTKSLYIYDVDLESRRPVRVDTSEPVPVRILGNHPNPFNPTTTITFSLSKAGIVDLDIVNVLGIQVKELVSSAMGPGLHSVIWDGRDYNGAPVSAGTYFSRLRVNDESVGGKMMLVR